MSFNVKVAHIRQRVSLKQFTVKNLINLVSCQRSRFLEDIAAEFLFSLQLYAFVRAVVNADAVLFSFEYTGIFFVIGGVEVIVKI